MNAEDVNAEGCGDCQTDIGCRESVGSRTFSLLRRAARCSWSWGDLKLLSLIVFKI